MALRKIFSKQRNKMVVRSQGADPWRLQSGTLGIQLECDEPFSWTRFFVSLFSYLLLLSDVARSGLGISNLKEYFPVQPDLLIPYGPDAYRVVHLNTTNATATTYKRIWPYKYDTTSLGMRSLVEHLDVTSWPPCVLYKGVCDETLGIPMSTLFSMIDSLVDATATHNNRGSITLRTETEFKDRLHHYVFPWFFDRPIKRTTQAIYHPHPTPKLCGDQLPKPYACQALWTKFAKGHCGRPGYPPCKDSLWSDIPRRQGQLLRAYPNHTLDFVIIENANDFSGGGLSFQGHQDFDIVALSRVRNCTAHISSNESVCNTIAVDDYRYETAYFNMDAPEWFIIVSILRIFGQTYMWVRVIFLFWGCFVVSSYTPQQRQLSPFRRLSKATKKFFLIPSQVVIYGSITPILAHASAHLIDSPATYELITSHFNSLLGDFKLNPMDFLHQCSVSMRTVWTLAIACHIAVTLASAHVWSPLHGTIGIPEFSISIVACATIFGQYKSVKLRRTRVLQIHEVIGSQKRREHYIGQSVEMLRSPFQKFISGTPLDAKCLLTALILLIAVVVLAWFLKQLFPKRMPFWMVLVSRSPVPASAGRLWERNRLVVSWFSSVIMTESKRRTSNSSSISQAAIVPSPASRLVTMERVSIRDVTRVAARTRDVESMILLVNLAAMTDPITILKLCVFSGQPVGLYESKLTRRRVLLPYLLSKAMADDPIDWRDLELLEIRNTKELSWHELLCCG